VFYKANDGKHSKKQMSCKKYQRYCECYAHLKDCGVNIYEKNNISKQIMDL
jgi:hypothetical protein